MTFGNVLQFSDEQRWRILVSRWLVHLSGGGVGGTRWSWAIRTQREKSPTQAALPSRRWPIKIDPSMLHDTETLLFQPSHYLGTWTKVRLSRENHWALHIWVEMRFEAKLLDASNAILEKYLSQHLFAPFYQMIKPPDHSFAIGLASSLKLNVLLTCNSSLGLWYSALPLK